MAEPMRRCLEVRTGMGPCLICRGGSNSESEHAGKERRTCCLAQPQSRGIVRIDIASRGSMCKPLSSAQFCGRMHRTARSTAGNIGCHLGAATARGRSHAVPVCAKPACPRDAHAIGFIKGAFVASTPHSILPPIDLRTHAAPRRHAPPHCPVFCTRHSSTSKQSVALRGMTPLTPVSPYAMLGGTTSRRLSPTRMPATPLSQPLMTSPTPAAAAAQRQRSQRTCA